MSDHIKKIKHISKKLEAYKCITQYDSPDDPESWRFANSFIDIEKSFEKIFREFFPKLLNSNDDDLAKDLLIDIGSEFDHIIYHIKDLRFYNYLFDENENKSE